MSTFRACCRLSIVSTSLASLSDESNLLQSSAIKLQTHQSSSVLAECGWASLRSNIPDSWCDANCDTAAGLHVGCNQTTDAAHLTCAPKPTPCCTLEGGVTKVPTGWIGYNEGRKFCKTFTCVGVPTGISANGAQLIKAAGQDCLCHGIDPIGPQTPGVPPTRCVALNPDVCTLEDNTLVAAPWFGFNTGDEFCKRYVCMKTPMGMMWQKGAGQDCDCYGTSPVRPGQNVCIEGNPDTCTLSSGRKVHHLWHGNEEGELSCNVVTCMVGPAGTMLLPAGGSLKDCSTTTTTAHWSTVGEQGKCELACGTEVDILWRGNQEGTGSCNTAICMNHPDGPRLLPDGGTWNECPDAEPCPVAN